MNRAGRHRRRSEHRRRQERLVGAHQRRREVARSQATQPRRGGVERDHALDPLPMLQRERKRHAPASVVSQEAEAVKSFRSHECDDVGRERGLRVNVMRGVRPPPAAEVGREYPVILRQAPHDATPAPLVLRPAVQQDQRRARSRLGDVEPHAIDRHVAMLDARHRRHVGQFHGRSGRSRTIDPYPQDGCSSRRANCVT
jgi:hypothetical protein